MNPLRRVLPVLVLLPALAVGGAACGDDDHDHHHGHDGGAGDATVNQDAGDDAATEADAGPLTRDVSIAFAVKVNGEAFACGETYENVGSADSDFTITDARFYVYGVELLDADGAAHPVALEDDAFQGNGVALLDFEDGCGSDGTEALHTAVTGTADNVEYTGVRFTLGVPADQNFVDVASAEPPLDSTAMFWIWQFGYKYLKIDGSADTGDGAASFFLHLGASGCPGDNFEAPPAAPCAFPNRVTVTLPAFSVDSSVITADLGVLLSQSDLTVNTPDTAPGCMSEANDPECITLLPRLGVNGAAEQALFTVE